MSAVSSVLRSKLSNCNLMLRYMPNGCGLPTISHAGKFDRYYSKSSSCLSGIPESKDSGSITTEDIVRIVAETHHLSLAESRRILDTVVDTVIDGVASDKNVKIADFGSFKPMISKPRSARNPRTGEAIQVPSKKRVRFRPTKHFKETVLKSQ